MFSYTAKSQTLNERVLCPCPDGLIQIHSAVCCLLHRIRILIIHQYSASHRSGGNQEGGQSVRSKRLNYGLNNVNGGGGWGDSVRFH